MITKRMLLAVGFWGIFLPVLGWAKNNPSWLSIIVTCSLVTIKIIEDGIGWKKVINPIKFALNEKEKSK